MTRALTFGVLALAGAAGCTTGGIRGADPAVLVEVPRPGVYPYATTPPAEEGYTAVNDGGSFTMPTTTTPLDADRLNLTLYTIEQQKLDAAAAERDLESARAQLVVVQPQALPNRVSGVNIALFAQQTTNAVGERQYARNRGGGFGSGCGRYRSADEAQRAFLAGGGPDRDPGGLDSDGDGFACAWDPTPYRQLRL